jgi:hypothetical protein
MLKVSFKLADVVKQFERLLKFNPTISSTGVTLEGIII